jgi:hypothetical protein
VAYSLDLWLCAMVTVQLQDVKNGGFVVVSAIDKRWTPVDLECDAVRVADLA